MKIMKIEYDKLTTLKQEQYSQEKMNLRRLLKLSLTKIYTMKDLNDSDVLNRALRLLFVTRYEQITQHMRISSHVEYDKLSKNVIRVIRIKMKKKNYQLQKCLKIFKNSWRSISFSFSLTSSLIVNKEAINSTFAYFKKKND
jgi:hypothetical protein